MKPMPSKYCSLKWRCICLNEVKCFEMERKSNLEKWNKKMLAQDIVNAFKINRFMNQSMRSYLAQTKTISVLLAKCR